MFKIDTHVHTKEVSRCGEIGAKEIVCAYTKMGYDGIVITDHFNEGTFRTLKGETWKEKAEAFLAGYKAAKDEGEKTGLSVYLGMELKTTENDNEFLVYGFDESFLFKNENLFLKPIAEIKKIIDENNLIIIQAHPYRIMCHAVSEEIVHGIEVFNGHFGHNSSNDMAERLLCKRGGIATSGSDCHDLCAAGNGGIIFREKPDNIADALRGGEYELIKSEPQWAKLLFAAEENRNKLKKICALKECDAAVLFGDAVMVSDRKGAEFSDEVPKVNRVRIIKDEKNIALAPETEPSVLICRKLSKKIKKMAEKYFVQAVVSLYGDDSAPYKENDVLYISFDMLSEGEMFSMDFMGSETALEKITL